MRQACVICRWVVVGNFPMRMCGTDTDDFPPPAARRKKRVSSRTFNVGSRKRGLTSPHQRCDGKRPCTMCVIGGNGAMCTYEPRQRSLQISTNAPLVSRDNPSSPLSVHTLPFEKSANRFSLSEPLTSPPSDISFLTWPNSSGPASSLPLLPPLAQDERSLAPSSFVHVLDSSSDIPVVQDIHSTVELVPRPTVSSFTVLPSIDFRTIPRPLQVPLSLVPPERVQVSPIARGDLDMKLFVLFRLLNFHSVVRAKPYYARRLGTLCRLNKLGIYFTLEKQDALFRGDTSNAIVNRHFAYGCQAVGTYFCGALDEPHALVRLLAIYGQKAWETIIEIQETNDKRLLTQALLFFVYVVIIKGWPSNAQLYLLKVCELISAGDFRFLPVYGRPPDLSEQVREDAAVLSQTIYLENYFYLALDGPLPAKTTKIEREFRGDFQVRMMFCGVQSGLSDLV